MKAHYLLFAAIVVLIGRTLPAQDSVESGDADYYESQDDFSLASYDRLLERVDAIESRDAKSHSKSSCDGVGCSSCCTSGETYGFYGLFENVFAKPFMTQSDAFVADDPDVGLGPTVADDATVTQPMNWDFEYSPRIELGYLAPSDQVGWRTRYWNFRTTEGVFLDGSQDINATVSIVDDPDVEIEDADFFMSQGTIEMNVLDVEAMVRNNSNTTYSAGVRWAKIDHNFVVAGDEFGGTAFDQYLFNQKDINVIGPTIAIERKVPVRIFGNNLRAIAAARAGVLFGQFEQIATSYNNDASLAAGSPADDGSVRRSNNFLVGNGELQLGLEWTKTLDTSQIFVRGIVEGQYWANGGSPWAYDNIGTDTDDYNDSFSDLGFLGLGITVGYMR